MLRFLFVLFHSGYMDSIDEKLSWFVLSQIPGIGVSRFWQLHKHVGHPSTILQSDITQLSSVCRLNKPIMTGFSEKEKIVESCLNELESLHALGGRMLVYEDETYPRILREMNDPPPVLFVQGDTAAFSSASIAIVGSRAATVYGKNVSYSFGKKLGEHNITVISGLALGIDTEAHRGALHGGGKTIAVLGCGLDVIYPSQNKKLHREIVENGAVVSEYPLGTKPDAFRFPARNRIIAGLSRGVMVVEAARKSGSLITAQLALDCGREIYAVPGQINSYKSEGTHWLLQQGAKLVQTEEDILEDLQIEADVSGLKKVEQKKADQEEHEDHILLKFIEPYPQPRDEIFQLSGMTISEFSESLLLLELEGLIEILPGDEICRTVQ